MAEKGFEIKRVNTLPTSGNDGDWYILKKGTDRHEIYVVQPNGTLTFVKGITDDENNRLDQLSQDKIDKLTDLPTKNQIDISNAEINSRIDLLSSGITGNLSINDSAPIIDGIYRAKESGTYTNIGGLVADPGYTTDFQLKSGVWSIFSRVSGASANGNIIIGDTNAVSGNTVFTQFDDVFVNKFYGSSVTDTYGTDNTTSVLTYGTVSNTARVHYNILNKALKNGFVKTIKINCITPGSITLIVGTQTNFTTAIPFNIRSIIGTYNLVLGINTININFPILKDEFIGINGGTAIISYKNYGSVGIDPTNRYVQAYTSANIPAVAAVGVSMTFQTSIEYPPEIKSTLDVNYATKESVPTLEDDVIEGDITGITGDKVFKQIEGVIIDKYLEPPVNTEISYSMDSLPSPSNFGAVSNGNRVHYNILNKAEDNGVLKQLVIDCKTAGTLNIVLGTHESILVPSAFVRRVIVGTFDLIVGINTINVNTAILKDEYVAINGGTAIIGYAKITTNSNRYISAYTSDVQSANGALNRPMGFGVTISYLIESPLKTLLDSQYKDQEPTTEYQPKIKITERTVSKLEGNNAVQLALNSITDASSINRYQINVGMGIYKITNGAEFLGNPSYPAMIALKDHIDIIGQSKSSTILHAELPYNDEDLDAVAQSLTRSRFQTIYNWADDVLVKNITFIGKNLRYVLHQDNSQEALKTRTYENCDFIFIGNKGFRFAFGIGTHNGSKTYVKGGKTSSPERASFSIHNNRNFTKASLWSFTDHYFENVSGEVSRGQVMNVKNDGSMQDCTLELVNCTSNQIVVNYQTEWLYEVGTNDCYNYANWRIIGSGNNPFFFSNEVLGKALMVKGNSNNSMIRFDETSSAYATLISNPYKYWGYLGHPEREIKSEGYIIHDGSISTKGYAIGAKSIIEGNAGNGVAYQCSLGIRLGDCSTVNKTLGIIVNNVTYNVIFNKNYTSLANSIIIAEINSVISSVALASEYNIGGDYYLEFNDVLSIGINGNTTDALPKGTLVTMKNNRLYPCGENDKLYGLLIDEACPYSVKTTDGSQTGKGRVIKNCYVTIESNKIQSVINSGTGNKYKIVNGSFVADINGNYILEDSKYILI